jgi:hypothetical protein
MGNRTAAAPSLRQLPVGARFLSNNNNSSNNKPHKAKKQGGKNNKNNNSKNNKGKSSPPALSFRFVFSEEDDYVADDDDDFSIITVASFPKNIQSLTRHFLESGMVDEDDVEAGLEVQTKTGDWEILHDVAQLHAISKRPILVRDPAMFALPGDDDEDDEDDDDYDEHGYGEYPTDDDDDDVDGSWNDTILELVQQLQASGYRPTTTTEAGAGTVQMLEKETDPTTSMSTRTWVLEQAAADDPLLQRILLGKVGALDHIVQCLHMPFVWAMANASDEEEDSEKDAKEADFTDKVE